VISISPEDFGYTQYSKSKITFPHPTVLTKKSQVITNGKWHLDKRGSLMEVYRAAWYEDGTGPVQQVYISTTEPGVVKAWHLHTKQTDRFVCVRGKVLVATCKHSQSEVETVVLDAERGPTFVHIPPGVAHGWKALGDTESWIVNLCSHQYDGTDEYRRGAHDGPWEDIYFDWNENVDG